MSEATKRGSLVGVGLVLTGLALVVASLSVLTIFVCADPGGCRTVYHWPTLLPGLLLLGSGLLLSAVTRRRGRHPASPASRETP